MASVSSALFHFKNEQWIFGDFTCKFLFAIPTKVAPTVSCWNLVLLSYERYRRLTRPFDRKIRKRDLTVVCLFIWLVFYWLHYFELFHIDDYGQCTGYSPLVAQGVDGSEEILFFTGILPILFMDCFVPAAFMLVFYRRISKYVIKSQQAVQNEQSLQLRRIKAALTLKRLLILYVISVFVARIILAAIICYTTFYRGPTTVNEDFGIIVTMSILDSLLYTNNVLNVFIYAHMMKDFRHFVIKLFLSPLACLKCVR